MNSTYITIIADIKDTVFLSSYADWILVSATIGKPMLETELPFCVLRLGHIYCT